MNPKDEVKFEDIKKLVNASLEKFYKNDRDLIEMSNEEDMISEQCMVFHIGKYSLQGTTQGRYLTGGVPPVRFSM